MATMFRQYTSPTHLFTFISSIYHKGSSCYVYTYYVYFLFCRTMHCMDYVVARCLSVRLSRTAIVSKRLNASLKFFYIVSLGSFLGAGLPKS